MNPPILERSLRLVRMTVFALLFFSAGTMFLLGDRIWDAIEMGSLPLWAGFVVPIAFTIFVLFFLLDRVLLVRQGRYPMMRAFVQVILSLVFLAIIWPQQTKAFRIHQHLDFSTKGLMELFDHREPRIRALTCEVLSYRKDVQADVLREQAEQDISGHVRKICAKAVERLE